MTVADLRKWAAKTREFQKQPGIQAALNGPVGGDQDLFTQLLERINGRPIYHYMANTTVTYIGIFLATVMKAFGSVTAELLKKNPQAVYNYAKQQARDPSCNEDCKKKWDSVSGWAQRAGGAIGTLTAPIDAANGAFRFPVPSTNLKIYKGIGVIDATMPKLASNLAKVGGFIAFAGMAIDVWSLANDETISDAEALSSASGTVGVDAGVAAAGAYLLVAAPPIGLLFAIGIGALTMFDPNWSTTAGKCVAGSTGSGFCGRNK